MYLSKEEVQLAIDRMPPKVENTHSIDPRTLIKRVLRKPAIYILFVFSVHGALLEAFAFQVRPLSRSSILPVYKQPFLPPAVLASLFHHFAPVR